MIDDKALVWRNLLLDFIRPYSADIPILLSGGMDSSTILAALLLLGRRPEIYHFQLDNIESKDYLNSHRMAQDYNLKFNVIPIKRDDDTLNKDIKEILHIVGVTHPTAIQTCQPLMYMIKALKEAGINRAFGGNPGIVDLTKKSHLINNRGNREEMDKFRRALAEAPGWGSYGNVAIDVLMEYYEFNPIYPYADSKFVEYSLSLSFQELNSPVQKGIAVRAFPEFHDDLKYWKNNTDLQVVSGISAWHNELTENTRYKKVVGVYNDMLRAEFPAESIQAGGGGTLALKNSAFLKKFEGFDKEWPRLPLK